jgi:benzoate membrane transport protein
MNGISAQALSAGAVAAVVGFGSSFAVVIAGLVAVGASPDQAASGLMAAALAMGFAGIVMGVMTRMPIAAAWSTPGAALLVTTGPVDGGFPAAVGAFLVTGVLIVAAAFWRPLAKLVGAIPAPVAAAMLAGVLLGLCLAPIKAAAATPEAALPVIAVWAVVAQVKRLWAVPAAALAAGVVVAVLGDPVAADNIWPNPLPVMPVLSWGAVIGIAVPLFIVTMASQNIPGFAVLRVNGYTPPSGPPVAVTGLFSMLGAPFGGHTVNLSAIVAALCAGPDAHPDPARRWWAAVSMGVVSVGLGLFASAVVAVVQAAPPLLIETVAGLALLGPLAAALKAALEDEPLREAAAVTFVVAASGLSILGVGAAFWGLLAGCAVVVLKRILKGAS